ncbi:MAG: pyridoxamine 5'-phosphate oxidase family protein [Candidatus Micrarchaeota archaeon]|nr:pyridoxamine 5'-phosphate oxidase family protein [Candidatus Micrarchaeota archaeon]
MDEAEKAALKELVKGIIEKGYLMNLATADNGGPWVSPIVYTPGPELTVYWLSDSNSRHSKAIAANPKVSASISISDRPGIETEAIQLSGVAEVLEGDSMDLAVRRSKKLNIPTPKTLGETLVYNNKRYGGDFRWYKIIPKKVDILYKKKFGDNKAFLEL